MDVFISRATIWKRHSDRARVGIHWSGGVVLVAILDIPLMLFFVFGAQGPSVFLIVLGVIFLLVDGLILSLAFLGSRMRYKLGEKGFTVNFGLSKRVIPYASISAVELAQTTLLLRLFGASWPGLHWGLYKAKDVEMSGFIRPR